MATLLHSDSRRMYSWWWDSHISPKNSKWLQENLKDMDAKVKAMIKLIEEDADSFARRAEMYYKKRPELMKLVEEFYRAYRALAERYDHATGELRQAHRTMAEAFPNQVPLVLSEDSPLGSSTHEADPRTPEMPHPIHAFLDLDDLQKEALALSASDLHSVQKIMHCSEESEVGISKKGLKQLNEMLGAGESVPRNSKFCEGKMRKGLNHETEEKERCLHGEISQLSNENHNLKSKVLSESDRAVRAENEVEHLKKALGGMEVEKEAVLLSYQQSLNKLSDLERELNHAKTDLKGLNERAIKAENKVLSLKEALVKLEAERDASFLQHKEYLERITNLEFKISQTQEESKGLNEQAIRAEIEAQYLNKELSRLETEKEAALLQYKQCLDKISELEKKLSISKEECKLLNERADRAETEVKKLENALAELSKEKEAAALQYEHCMIKISKLESEISCAKEDINHLKSEILMGVTKLKSAEEKHILLEKSNQSLQVEADDLAKKIAIKDQELLEKNEELDKLQNRLEDEQLHFVQLEASLQTLQNLHAQSQEEQRALTLELKNGLQMFKDLETCKHGLEEEIKQARDENQILNELNSSYAISTKSLQNEVLGLRDMKERLEAEVALQMGRSDTLQQEIGHLKEEIKILNERYHALMEQVVSVGLNPESLGSTVKDLQDETSKLRQRCQQDRDEKEALFRKLAEMEKFLELNAVLESSLSDVNTELEMSQEKVKTLQQSCQLLQGEKSSVVAEKAALLSQLQIVTENMQKLLEKNSVLENSLSGANIQIQGLREKSKSLEDVCQLLSNEKSNLLTERGALVVQLENVERKLENLENRFTGLEVKYAALDMEKQATLSQVEELKVSLCVEKQERQNYTLASEIRLNNLESYIRLLQDESRQKKKEFEEELDKAMNAQFEIFIMKKFIQDMEEKNYSLLIECQKHVEASKLTEKLISELESENLEQQVEAELLLDEIEKLRMGIYQVFKALEIDPDNGYREKTKNEQIFVHHILGNIEDIKLSLSKYEEDKQHLSVENSVLRTLLEQLRLKGLEIESEKEILEHKLEIMNLQLVMAQNEKSELLEMNGHLKAEVKKKEQRGTVLEANMESLCVKQADLQRAYLELQEENSKKLEENRSLLKMFSDLKQEMCMVEENNDYILLKTLALDSLSVIFKSFGTEKSMELEALTEDMHSLHELNGDLGMEVRILRQELEMKETRNLFLKDSVEKLEKELRVVKNINCQLIEEVSHGKGCLKQKETEIFEAEQKLKATGDLNSELCETVEGLKRECEASKLMTETLIRQTIELSEKSTVQNKEIDCLREVNGNLGSELHLLREEIEQSRVREEKLSLELQGKCNEFELWEAEAATFYFDLQISAIHEVLFENKVHELTGVCQSLEDESASKSLEINQMKERVYFMESEIGALKAQLFAYAPLIVSLRENIASLEQNTLSQAKLNASCNPEAKVADLAVHPHGKSCPQLTEGQNTVIMNGISDLHELQARIKAVEQAVVEEMERHAKQENSEQSVKLEAAMKEIEELKSKCMLAQEVDEEKSKLGAIPKWQKGKPEEMRNDTLMKDIQLDQVAEGSSKGISRRADGGEEDQMLELWESAEDCSLNQTVGETYNQAYEATAYEATEDGIVYHRSEDTEKNEDPSSELQAEKELSVDKLEVSTSVSLSNREGNQRKILERLASDAQKLTFLLTTAQELRRKLEANKKSKKTGDVDLKTVKEQLQEVEESVLQLVSMNGKLAQSIEENPSYSDGQASTEFEEAANIRRRKVSEQARKGSEKIGRLQLEVQKIQYVLLKLEDEKRGRGKSAFSSSRTNVILRDFLHRGKKGSARQRKPHLCGCFRASSDGGRNFV